MELKHNIVLFGSQGRLGRTFLKAYPETVGYGRDTDIRDSNNLKRILEKHQPEIAVNCAALTNIEICEAQPEKCWEVNCKAVQGMAEICRSLNIQLVHISSNYAVNPLNQYGMAKKESEEAVKSSGLVLRTDLYDTQTFLVKKLLFSDERVSAYSDKYFNPISMVSFIRVIFEMLDLKGIYNIGTLERKSMADFGRLICKVFGLNENRVQPVCSDENGQKVPRPKDLYIKPFISLSIEEDLRRFQDALKIEKDIGDRAAPRR